MVFQRRESLDFSQTFRWNYRSSFVGLINIFDFNKDRYFLLDYNLIGTVVFVDLLTYLMYFLTNICNLFSFVLSSTLRTLFPLRLTQDVRRVERWAYLAGLVVVSFPFGSCDPRVTQFPCTLSQVPPIPSTLNLLFHRLSFFNISVSRVN